MKAVWLVSFSLISFSVVGCSSEPKRNVVFVLEIEDGRNSEEIAEIIEGRFTEMCATCDEPFLVVNPSSIQVRVRVPESANTGELEMSLAGVNGVSSAQTK